MISTEPAPGAPPTPLPLADLIGLLMNLAPTHARVHSVYTRLLQTVGNERHILIEATPAKLHKACVSDLAAAIVRQRTNPPGLLPATQLSFDF